MAPNMVFRILARFASFLCSIRLHSWKQVAAKNTEGSTKWLIHERCAWCPKEQVRDWDEWDQMRGMPWAPPKFPLQRP